MSLNIKVSGVWKTDPDNFVKVSGAWKTTQEIWTKVSGTWKLVYERLLAATPDWALTDVATQPSNASVSMRLYANGVYHGLSDNITVSSGTWLVAGANSDFEVMFVKNSGTDPSGSLTNTWLALSSDRSWNLNENTNGPASKSADGVLTIRTVVSQTTKDTSTVSMYVETIDPA